MIEDIPEALSDQSKYYLRRLQEEPDSWELRKEAALQLYDEGEYALAADVVWLAAEIPSTDMDIAFVIKVVSRAKPNRSIRMVYDLMRHNLGKAEQMIALANVFNLIGFPMLAARSYGAAMTLNPELFDVGFERQSLYVDDDAKLQNQWLEHAQLETKEDSFSEYSSELVGEPIRFEALKRDLDATSFMKASEAAAKGDITELVPAFEKLQNVIQPQQQAGPKPPLLVPPVENKPPLPVPPVENKPALGGIPKPTEGLKIEGSKPSLKAPQMRISQPLQPDAAPPVPKLKQSQPLKQDAAPSVPGSIPKPTEGLKIEGSKPSIKAPQMRISQPLQPDAAPSVPKLKQSQPLKQDAAPPVPKLKQSQPLKQDAAPPAPKPIPSQPLPMQPPPQSKPVKETRSVPVPPLRRATPPPKNDQ